MIFDESVHPFISLFTCRSGSDSSQTKDESNTSDLRGQQQARARRAVLKMLGQCQGHSMVQSNCVTFVFYVKFFMFLTKVSVYVLAQFVIVLFLLQWK